MAFSSGSKKTKISVTVLISFCLLQNACLAEVTDCTHKLNTGCLAPVAKLDNEIIKQGFIKILQESNEQGLKNYLEIFKLSPKVAGTHQKLLDLFKNLKNISDMINVLDHRGMAFKGVLSPKDKKQLEVLLKESVAQINTADTELFSELNRLLDTGLKNIQRLRNLQVRLAATEEYRHLIQRLIRKFIEAQEIITDLQAEAKALARKNEKTKAKKGFLTKTLWDSLSDELSKRGIALDHVSTLIIEINEGDDAITKAEQLISAADKIAFLIDIFEQKEIDSDYITEVLKAIISSKNVRKIGIILPDSETILNIANLAERFELKGIERSLSLAIIKAIFELDDVKERSSVLEAFFSSPDLQFIGENNQKTVSILQKITHLGLNDIKAIIFSLKQFSLKMPETEEERHQVNRQIRQLKADGEFKKSVVACEGITQERKGTAFVIGETEEEYQLITNNHVVDSEEDVLLRTQEPESILIGRAKVKVCSIDNRLHAGDLAILTIKKEDVQIGKLIPIKIADELPKGMTGVLVSGYNKTVSSGELIKAGNSIILAGANSIQGDSGSPILIRTKTGFEAVGILATAGPTGIYLRDDLIGDLLNPKNQITKNNLRLKKVSFTFLQLQSKTIQIKVARPQLFNSSEIFIAQAI